MKHQRYLPDTETGINDLLVAMDTNLPGELAAKYNVNPDQLFRLKQGRLVYGWFTAGFPTCPSCTWARPALRS